MGKSDKSLHNISIAAIIRHTMKPYEFKWTQWYESSSDFTHLGIELDCLENEMIICSTAIDLENYSILTTQRLITSETGIKSIGSLVGAVIEGYGDFKGYKNKPFTFGTVQLKNGAVLKYFVETGKASMVMITGVKTLVHIQR